MSRITAPRPTTSRSSSSSRRFFVCCFVVAPAAALVSLGPGVAPNVLNQLTIDPAAVTSETQMFMSMNSKNQIVASSAKIPGNSPLAEVNYNPTMNKRGWDFLKAKTDECKDNKLDPVKAFAAGFAEGYLTRQLIHDFRFNTEKESGILDDPKTSEQALTVLNQQDEWVAMHDCPEESDKTSDACKYNRQAYLVHMQMHGVMQGANAAIEKHHTKSGPDDTQTPYKFTMFDILRLNCDGAIRDYLEAYKRATAAASSFYEQQQQQNEAAIMNKSPDYRLGEDGQPLPGRCSAMVKMVKDEKDQPQDIFLGHTTWEDFTESTRTWKVGMVVLTIVCREGSSVSEDLFLSGRLLSRIFFFHFVHHWYTTSRICC